MKEFDTEKWFSKFDFDQKESGKNELCCNKIADKEQIQGCISTETYGQVFYT